MPTRFEEVGFNSASRAGEPFEGLIELRGRLPNALQRFCSRELKVEPIKALCRSLGWDHWLNVIGLRYDEGWRVMKKLAENDKGGHRWKSVMPMASGSAKATKRDVLTFWLGPTMRMSDGKNPQGFDLGLEPHEGNCDLCFLKSRSKLEAIIRSQPGAEHWWIAQEANGKRFERARSYAEIAEATHAQPDLLNPIPDGGDYDAECGSWCAADAA